jgi:phosphohistidine phosphatase
MKLYVMRHGPAEDHAESGLDGDRALTAAGRERTRAVAKALLDGDEMPLLVLTSPLVRAVQTAEIVAVTTELSDRSGTVATSRELAPGGDGATLARSLARADKRRVMLVGHEPDLSELVARLLGNGLGRSMDKSMVVGLRLPAHGPAKLRFVLEPRRLSWENDRRADG